MTLGEKIQQCRKRLSMSQEDLGQKMLVSRQTVSLWESDKTMPTIDNLVRLREIFGISLDELLTGELPEADDEKQNDAKERTEFDLSAAELAQITKITRKRFWYNIIAAVLGCIVCIFCIVSDFSSSTGNFYYSFYCIALGVFLIRLGTWAAKYLKYKKTWKKHHGGAQSERYSFEIFDDDFIVRHWRDGELQGSEKISFSDIELAEDYGKYYAFKANERSYWLKKEELAADSRFHSVCGKKHDKKFANSVSLNQASLMSPILALFCCVLLNMFFNDARNIWGWVFIAFSLIPLATLGYGIYLNNQKRRSRWSIVIGCFMLILLLFLGLSLLLSERTDPEENSPVLMVEKASGVDIPKYSHILSQDTDSSMIINF